MNFLEIIRYNLKAMKFQQLKCTEIVCILDTISSNRHWNLW